MIYELWDVPTSTLLLQTERKELVCQAIRALIEEDEDKFLDDLLFSEYDTPVVEADVRIGADEIRAWYEDNI